MPDNQAQVHLVLDMVDQLCPDGHQVVLLGTDLDVHLLPVVLDLFFDLD